MLSEFFNWYLNLFSDSDNKIRLTVWTATLATLTFTITFILKPSRKFMLKQIGGLKSKINTHKFPVLQLEADEFGQISPIKDKYFDSKILLAKKLYEVGNTGIGIKLKPNYSLRKFDRFRKEKIKLELDAKALIIEEKIKILLSRYI